MAIGVAVLSLGSAWGLGDSRLLPPDSWMVFSIPNLPVAWNAASQTATFDALDSLLKSDEGAAVAPGYRAFLEDRARLEKELGFALTGESLVEIFKAIDFVILAPLQSDQPPLSLLILHAADPQRAKQLFRLLERRLMEQAGDGAISAAAIRRQTYSGVEIISSRSSAAAMAVIGEGQMVLANHPAAIRRIIDQSKESQSLIDSPEFRRAVSGLKEKEPHGLLYFNGAEAGAMFPRGGAQRIPGAVLLRTFPERLVLAADFHIGRDALRFESYLPFPADERERLASAYRYAPPARLRSLDYASSAPLLLTARNTIDGLAIYETVRSIVVGSVAQMLPDEPRPEEKVAAAERRFREALGFDLREDLAPAVGPEMFVSVEDVRFDPLVPMPIFSLLAGVQVRDATRMERVLNGLTEYFERCLSRVRASGGPRFRMEENEHDGEVIRWFPVPRVPLYALSYAKTDDFVLAGLSPDSVAAAIDRLHDEAQAFPESAMSDRVGTYLHDQCNAILVLNLKKAIAAGREVARRLASSRDPDQARTGARAAAFLERLTTLEVFGATTAGSEVGVQIRGAVVFHPTP
jgi:hypothetical protein